MDYFQFCFEDKEITVAALQIIIAGSNIIIINPITTANHLMLMENKAKINTNVMKIIHISLPHLCFYISFYMILWGFTFTSIAHPQEVL